MNLKKMAPALAALACFAMFPAARAESACNVAALVEAETDLQQTNFPNAEASADKSATDVTADSTLIADYQCGNWNYQFSLYGSNQFQDRYSYGSYGYNSSDQRGSGTFNLFWRDPSSYALGGGIRYSHEDDHEIGFGSADDQNYHRTWDRFNAHIFADTYVNDRITLGISGGATTGNYFDGYDGSNNPQKAYGVGISGSYYVDPNVKVVLGGGLGGWNTKYASYDQNGTSYYTNASLHYKVASLPLQLFAGVEYGASNWSNTDATDSHGSNYVDGFLGFSYALGAHANGTLVEQDRNGVLN